MFCNHLVFALKEKFHGEMGISWRKLPRMYLSLFTEFSICLFSVFNVLTFGVLFPTASYARKYHFTISVLCLRFTQCTLEQTGNSLTHISEFLTCCLWGGLPFLLRHNLLPFPVPAPRHILVHFMIPTPLEIFFYNIWLWNVGLAE